MIRKAEMNDVQAIAETYAQLLTYEQTHGSHSNWVINVYPTVDIPRKAIPEETMFVLEQDGDICASMIMNNKQASEYRSINWLYPAADENVMVIHTLCVPPAQAGHGYATQMISFAKDYAQMRGYSVIRIDTFSHNEPAKTLYQKNGFRISGYADCLLQDLIPEEQVFLEYRINGD